MTKKDQEYLERLEDCFAQLQSDYLSAQDEIRNLQLKLENAKKTCPAYFKENDFKDAVSF